MKTSLRLTALALSITLLFSLGLAGCGGGDADAGQASSPTGETADAGETANAEDTGAGESSADGLDFGEYSVDNPLMLKSASYGKGEKNYHNIASTTFSAALEEASGGVIDVEVYNEGLLAANDRELLDGLNMGTWDIGYNNTGVMSNYNGQYSILDLPYLFQDYDHINTFLESDLAVEMTSLLNDQNVVTLAIAFYGFRNTALTNAPVATPEDLEGVLIRVMESDYYVKAFEAFGAEPQSMAATEIITALQQGTIEAVENSNNVFLNSGHYEFCPYMSKTEHVGGFYGINFAKETWDSLTPDLQNLILETAQKTAIELSLQNEEAADQNEASLVEKGMTVNTVDKAAFQAKCESVYQEYIDAYGSEWYDEILAMAG